MGPNKNPALTIIVIILLLVFTISFIYSDNKEITGDVINSVKGKYFLFEETTVNKLQNFENKFEKDVDNFYKEVDDIENEIVNGIEEFAASVNVNIGEIVEDQVGSEEEMKEGKEIEEDGDNEVEIEEPALDWNEICEEVLINLNFCYVNGISANDCGIQIYSQLIELFDMTNEQVLEVEDRCIS